MAGQRTLVISIIGDSASAERAFAKTSAAANATSASVTRAGEKVTSLGTSVAGVGKKLTTHVSLPILAIGAAAGKMSLDFNRSMLEVGTQAGASSKEVKKLSGDILKLSAAGRFAQGPNELAEGLFDIESSGIRGAKALKLLKATSDLASVGNANLEATTSAVVGVQKTQIKGTETMRQEIGLLNAGIGAGKLHMDDLNAAIGTGFIGRAKALGLSLGGVLAPLGELTSQAVPASSAATRLGMTFSLLATPTEKAQGVLKGIGIGTEDLAKRMRSSGGVVTALELLKEKLSGLSKIEQTQLLSEAYGGAKSGGTILQLLNNLDDLSAKQRQIIKNSGDIGEAIKHTNEDPAVQFEKEWSAIQADLIELGNVLIPALEPVIKDIGRDAGDVAHIFESLSPSSQSWVVKIGLAAAALGPVLVVGGNLLKVFGGIERATAATAKWLGIIDTEQAAGGVAAGGTGGAAVASGAGGVGGVVGAGGAGAAAGGAGAFGEKQALRDVGLLGAGGGVGKVISAPGGLTGAGKVVLPATVLISELAIGSEEHKHKIGGGGILNTLKDIATAGPDTLLHGGFGVPGIETLTNRAAGGGEKFGRLIDRTPRSLGIKPTIDPAALPKIEMAFRSTMANLSQDSLKGIGAVNKDLNVGLGIADRTWEVGTAKWRQHTVAAMQRSVKAIRMGMADGVIKTKQGEAEINELLGKIHMIKGDDPLGLAKGLARSFKKGGGVTNAWLHTFTSDMEQMPKVQREAAVNGTLGMLRAWADGHPKLEHQIKGITNMEIAKFGATNKQLREGVEKGATGPVADAFHELANGVGGALQNIGTNTSRLLKVLGDKSIGEFEVQMIGNGKEFTSHKEAKEGVHHTHRATGGKVTRPTLYEVGEEAPAHHEWVIAENPAYRSANIGYWMQAGHDLGIPGFKKGGLPHPQVTGGAAGLRAMGQQSIDDAWGVASKVIAAAQAQKQSAAGGPGGSGSLPGTGAEVPGHPELQPGISRIVNDILQHFSGLTITSTTGGVHATGSLHYSGRAADLAASSPYMLKAAGWIDSTLGRSLTEGIHNPNLSVKYGHEVPSGYWGPEVWAEHLNHIHVGYAKGGKVLARGRSGRSEGPPWEPKFQARTQSIWEKAAHLYGRSGSSEQPQIWLARGLTKAEGDVAHVSGAVVAFDRGWGKQLLAGNDYAEQALLHEWAHVFQKPGLKVWEKEGGATDFARWAAPQVYGDYAQTRYPAGYRKYADAVQSKRGKDWIEKGQFEKEVFYGFRKGGLVSGKVSYFGGGATAGGSNTSQPGIALNLNPGTEAGWDNATTREWRDDSLAGHPDFARVTIEGHTANLPITDMGPAASTGRAIDVTEGGVRKLGFTTSNFPTDATGTAVILGAGSTGKAKKSKVPHFPAGHTGTGGGTYGSPAGPVSPPKSTAPTLPPLHAGKVPAAAAGLSAGFQHMLTQPGLSSADQYTISERAIETAEHTKSATDDEAALRFQEALLHKQRKTLDARIKQINRELKQRLKRGERQKLLEERSTLIGEVSSNQSSLAGDREKMHEVRHPETEEEDPAVVAAEKAQEAAEEEKRAVEELKASIDELSKEIAKQNAIASSEMGINLAEAKRAMADMISGQLGPKVVQGSLAVGIGTVGSS